MKRLILYGLMSVMLLFTGCTFHEDVENVENVSNNQEMVEDFGGELSLITEDVSEEEAVELPIKYEYTVQEGMPSVKNQEGSNTCWAFASLTALESSKSAEFQDKYSVDHLRLQNPFGREFEDGGSYVVPMAYLLSWNGPVPEEEDPFDGTSSEELEPVVHVQEIRISEPKDYDAIKRFVYLYGGVETALYLDFNEFMQSSACYNEETYAYCYQGEEISNHDVVIIGWDDTFPKENFHGDVTADGAFLCQNSWGTTFGNQGKFYVSYEDVNIGGYGVVYSGIESKENYDRIYQSDLCGFTAQIGYENEECWFANVYTPKEDVNLRAAGFYATGKNTAYQLYVVPEFQEVSSLKRPTLLCKGVLKDAGYYTIPFPKSVQVEAGKDFAVVVNIDTEGAEYPVAIECPVEGLSEKADLSDGRGYLSYQGIVWEHIEETKNYNICLKVYADLTE